MSGVERGGGGADLELWESASFGCLRGGKAERFALNETWRGLRSKIFPFGKMEYRVFGPTKTKDFPLRKDGIQSLWAD